MSRVKDSLLVSGAVAAIVTSGVWIYSTQFGQPAFNMALHQRVGEVLAEQTAKLIHSNGQVVVVTMDTDDKPQYRTGAGLSSRRFLRIVKKSSDADAIVSFIGAPRMTEEEMEQVDKAPKFIAECRSPDKIKRLFDKKILQLAVINRFDYPAPIKHNPKTPRQWFEKYYQIVTTETASDLPKNSGD